MNIIIWDYDSVWPDLGPQNKCRSLWPIFHGQMILSNTLKIDVWTSLFGIISQYDPPEVWPQNKYRSLWSIFHGSVILLYIWKTIWCMNIILWDYGLVWPTFDLKINVDLCDLYFMVQWFCLISPRLFDTWVSYFQTMRQCDPNFDLKVYINQHDIYIYIYKSTWPIIHGLVILLDIFKIIWWMNITVGIMDQCDT